MSYRPTPKQALLLWRLIAAETEAEREPMVSAARPELTPTERGQLVKHGLVELERRGRGRYYILTDKAWATAAEMLDVEILKSRSTTGAEALQGVLRHLLTYANHHEIPIASIFSSLAAPEPAAKPAVSRDTKPSSRTKARSNEQRATQSKPAGDTGTTNGLATTIERACVDLTGGRRQERVRLTALRKKLRAVSREKLDAALLELQDQGRLVLYRDDNTSALTEADHDAALIVGNAPRHLVYLEA